MANVLKINGITTVLGQEVRNVMGGFGEGNKCILATDIAKVHSVKNEYVNKLINNNINIFTNDDLVDFLNSSEELRDFAKENSLITNNRVKNIYLLSERGYIKLVSAMDNSNVKKWEVMNSLIDDYFRLKEENVSLKESNDNLKQIATSDESVDKRTLKVKYNDLFRNTMIKKSFKNCKVTELKEFYADFIEFSEAVGIKPQDMKVKYKHIINQLESMLTPLALAEGTISGGEYIYVHELVGKVKDDKNENDNRINGGKKSAQTKENKKLKAENKALNDKLQRYIDMYGDMD